MKVGCEEEDESGDGSENENKPGTGGPCHLYGGEAPHQQTNTRACGQSSQEPEIGQKRPAGLAPSQATNLEPGRQTGLVPSQAANTAQVSKLKIAEGEPMVEIKTACRVNVRNAKNAYTDASKNVLNDRICQGMSEIGQNEVGSLRYEIMKNDIQNVKNGVSGRKEISAKFLETRRKLSKYSTYQKLHLHNLHIQRKEKLVAARIFCLQCQRQQNVN